MHKIRIVGIARPKKLRNIWISQPPSPLTLTLINHEGIHPTGQQQQSVILGYHRTQIVNRLYIGHCNIIHTITLIVLELLQQLIKYSVILILPLLIL